MGLRRDNPIYTDVEIDEDSLNSWDATFIPSALTDSITIVDDTEADSEERQGYDPAQMRVDNDSDNDNDCNSDYNNNDHYSSRYSLHSKYNINLNTSWMI